ncbi:MAG: VWA domain-containing protein [Candidatus Adiutrix sp.]|jgi:hypothetical protein|nr:VWA domain-containing protein [Candidatus Adiutrix sp.]
MLKKMINMIILCLFCGGPAAWAQELTVKAVDCEQWPAVRLRVAWPGAGETAGSYSLRLAPDGPALPAAALQRPAETPEPVSIVAALDTSKSLAPDSLAAAKKALADYVNQLKEGEQIALLAFNDSVQLVSGFTGDRAVLTKALNGLTVGGSKTELYKAMLFSLDLLKNHPGRRLLLVVSDGQDEGLEVTSWDVLKAAKENQLQISAVGLSGSALTDGRHLNILENFAKETGGLYRRAENAVALSLAMADLLKAPPPGPAEGYLYDLTFNLEPAGPMTAASVQAVLTRKLGPNSRTVEFTLNPPAAALAPPPPAAEESPPPAAEEPAPEEEAPAEAPAESPAEALDEAPPLWARPWLWGVAAGAAALLLLVLVVFLRRRKAADDKPTVLMPPDFRDQTFVRPTVALPPETRLRAARTVQNPSPFVLEFAEFGLRFPLALGLNSLGADSGNSLRLDVPTVSGRHAHLEVSATECRIKDLNSTNGTLVNGAAISGYTRLKDGDLLKFGTAQGLLRLAR